MDAVREMGAIKPSFDGTMSGRGVVTGITTVSAGEQGDEG